MAFFTDRTFWQRDRIIQIETIEINPEIDEQMFVIPNRKEIEKLEFLVGDWDVKVQAWTRRGTWYDFGTTTSAFHFADLNLLQENITYERNFRISKTINYTYNEPNGNYRISVFNDLATTMDIYEGNLTDTSFVFDNAKINFGDKNDEGKEYIQYSIYNIEKDSFILERKNSTDKGETWNPRDKFTYTRKVE